MRDYNFLDYQIQNLIPASYDIEDPSFSSNIDEAMARDWVERTTQNSFIEPADFDKRLATSLITLFLGSAIV